MRDLKSSGDKILLFIYRSNLKIYSGHFGTHVVFCLFVGFPNDLVNNWAISRTGPKTDV